LLHDTLSGSPGYEGDPADCGRGVLEIEVRILETDDKRQIYMTWAMARKKVIDRLNRADTVDPDTYYFRTTPYFEMSSSRP
jgi:hypothetical protein